jgi:hypothetical protein
MTSRQHDWWQVQAIHPHKTEPFDIYINSFPTEARAREVMASIKEEGYEHINLIEPDRVKKQRAVSAYFPQT